MSLWHSDTNWGRLDWQNFMKLDQITLVFLHAIDIEGMTCSWTRLEKLIKQESNMGWPMGWVLESNLFDPHYNWIFQTWFNCLSYTLKIQTTFTYFLFSHFKLICFYMRTESLFSASPAQWCHFWLLAGTMDANLSPLYELTVISML